MKYLRYLALLALLTLPLAYSQAAVSVGVGIGVAPVAGPPVCTYGYYPDYPYACAPYGYYGPDWFVGGVFIGAGPWYHGWGHPYYGRGFGGHYYGHGPVVARNFGEHAFARPSFAGRAPAASFHGGGGFHGRR